MRAIVADQLVLCTDLGASLGFTDVLDLRDREALLEKLTRSDAPPRVRIRSWGGTTDAKLGLEDL